MKSNVFSFQDRNAIEEQAREWLIRLDGDTPLTSSESEALRAWAARSPAHRAELQRIARFWNQAGLLSQLAIPLRRPRRDVREWLSGSLFVGRNRSWTVAACIALLGIAIIVAPLALRQPLTASNGLYTTRIGDRQVQTLADGSVIELNTASTLQVDFTEDVRVIRLLQGEAHFRVAHDTTRPFEVFAGDGMVRAVGTAFSVRVKQNDVAVTVAEGRVELAAVTPEQPPVPATTNEGNRSASVRSHSSAKPAVAVLGQLSSGHSATFGEVIHEVRTLRADDLSQQLAWRDGMLVFAGEPLSDVIAEVARYTPIQIEIADPALCTIPVGGRFKAGDVDAIFDALAMSFGIEVVRVDARHVRLTARHARPGDSASSDKPARDT